jgi:hypothetical protein
VTDEDFVTAASPDSANSALKSEIAQHRAAPSAHGAQETFDNTGFSVGVPSVR